MLVVNACTIGTDRMNKGLAARAEEGGGNNKSLAGWDFHHPICDAVNRVLRGLASDTKHSSIRGCGTLFLVPVVVTALHVQPG